MSQPGRPNDSEVDRTRPRSHLGISLSLSYISPELYIAHASEKRRKDDLHDVQTNRMVAGTLYDFIRYILNPGPRFRYIFGVLCLHLTHPRKEPTHGTGLIVRAAGIVRLLPVPPVSPRMIALHTYSAYSFPHPSMDLGQGMMYAVSGGVDPAAHGTQKTEKVSYYVTPVPRLHG